MSPEVRRSRSVVPNLAVAALSLALLAAPMLSFAAWSVDGAPVCTLPETQYQVAIASDWLEGAIIAWQDMRLDAFEDIFVQRLNGNGAPLWGANGVPLCTAANSQGDIQLLPDFANGAVALWTDFRAGIGITDVYGQRINSLGAPQWTANGVPLCTGTVSTLDYRVRDMISDGNPGVVSSSGYLMAIGEEDPLGNVRVLVQHVDLTGGGLWAPASTGGVFLTSSWRWRFGLRMVTDGTGLAFNPKGAVVVWAEDLPGTGIDIYARRVNASGAPQWAADGIGVCTLNNTQMAPDIVYVGGGSVVVAWDDARDGQSDIYAQKIDSAGNMLWTAQGAPVCVGAGRQSDPRVIFNGTGGAIVVWHDTRHGIGSYRIYAQCLDANGQRLWGNTGIPLANAGDAQWWEPRVESDLAGGAIVTWADDIHDDGGDIFAQRVDANGNLLWGAAGMPLCLASNAQTFPVVVTDGESGAVFAWADARSDVNDVYALRVAGSGGTVDAPVIAGPLGAPTFSIASANPTRGATEFVIDLARGGPGALDIFDVSGRRVRAVPLRVGTGSSRVVWDGCDTAGVPVGAGTYFVRMSAAGARQTQKVVVVR